MGLSIIEKAKENSDRKALVDRNGSYTYHYLLQASASIAAHLLDGKEDLSGARVTFMVTPSMYFVATAWAIWRAGGVAVPLHVEYPAASVQYVLEDAEASILVVDKKYKDRLQPLTENPDLRFITVEELIEDYKKCELPDVSLDRDALIVYTSGTTAQPKGVLSDHLTIEAQIKTLVDAWKWEKTDYILNVLPLHHVHGLINALACPLYIGACCELHPEFDPKEVWSDFEEGRVNIFMAVPTIYYKLITAFDDSDDYKKKRYTEALNEFRLMVSGSAALPIKVLQRWEEISGHRLLERYGMTELGMVLSNPYEGPRVPGHVGQALPGVEVRLYDEDKKQVIQVEDRPGEIQVKGANVFKGYWNRPEATHEAFTEDGWFKTGDIATLEDGSYRIMGRKSTDIIKSGGYKLSALEIEEVLRQHDAVKYVAIVGLENEEWGEVVGAAIVPALPASGAEQPLDQQLKDWLREQLPPYKLPRRWLIINELPRNALGKVQKNELKKLFEPVAEE